MSEVHELTSNGVEFFAPTGVLCTVYSDLYRVNSVKCRVYHLVYRVYSLWCTAYSVQSRRWKVGIQGINAS